MRDMSQCGSGDVVVAMAGVQLSMIIRNDPNGGLILVGQTDHSRFVGQLAAHWGNAHFETPRPYDSVVRAATFHDYGWLRYETSPLINPESGEACPVPQG